MNEKVMLNVPLLVEAPNGDWYYCGPIEPALRVMAASVDVVKIERRENYWRTAAADFAPDNYSPDTEHEWGNATTLDGALRFLLGAHFSFYAEDDDEALLRVLLNEAGAS